MCATLPAGPVVGKFCIDLAIKKAKEAGIGWVSAQGNTLLIYQSIKININILVK